MIQPISNNVNFGGKVVLGGSTYSALKASVGNIQGLPTEKLKEEVGENIEKLKQHIAKITPDDANLALIFGRTDRIGDGSNKLKLLLEDMQSGKRTQIAAKRIHPNGRSIGVDNFFSRAANKVDTLFASNKTVQGAQETLGQNIDKFV